MKQPFPLPMKFIFLIAKLSKDLFSRNAPHLQQFMLACCFLSPRFVFFPHPYHPQTWMNPPMMAGSYPLCACKPVQMPRILSSGFEVRSVCWCSFGIAGEVNAGYLLVNEHRNGWNAHRVYKQKCIFNHLPFSSQLLLMEKFLHHLGCPKCWFYPSIKTFSGILSGAGFFPSTVCLPGVIIWFQLWFEVIIICPCKSSNCSLSVTEGGRSS